MGLPPTLQQVILGNIKTYANRDQYIGPVFDTVWTGPFNESRPIQQTSALDLLLAGVEEGVSSTGVRRLTLLYLLAGNLPWCSLSV